LLKLQENLSPRREKTNCFSPVSLNWKRSFDISEYVLRSQLTKGWGLRVFKKTNPGKWFEKKNPVSGSFHYVDKQAFQVFPFRMVDADGMINTVPETPEDLNRASNIRCSGKNNLLKKFWIDKVGTRKGK